MPKFVPLTFLKDTASIVEFCQECGEPIFVTRNGIPEMVIMDSEFFNEYLHYRKKDGRLDIKREFARVPKTITIKDLKNTSEVSELCCQKMNRSALFEMSMVYWLLSVLQGMRSGMLICGMEVNKRSNTCIV